MNENADAGATTELTQQATTDTTGVALAVVVALVAVGLLLWHVQQVKKRPATTYDKAVAGLWAAVIVMAVARVIALLA